MPYGIATPSATGAKVVVVDGIALLSPDGVPGRFLKRPTELLELLLGVDTQYGIAPSAKALPYLCDVGELGVASWRRAIRDLLFVRSEKFICLTQRAATRFATDANAQGRDVRQLFFSWSCEISDR